LPLGGIARTGKTGSGYQKNANDGHNMVICLYQMFDFLAVIGQDWDLVRCVK